MKKLLFAGLLAGFFLACHKDFDTTTVTSPGPVPTVNVEASLYGRVLSLYGDVLSGVKVQVDGQTLTTNAQGLFFLYNRQLNRNGAYVQASAPGYFSAARFAYPQLGSSTYMEITLVNKYQISFSTAATADVAVAGGATVSIPAQSLVTAGGQPYSGNFLVAARWLDPSDPATFTQMPGDLRAQDAGGLAKVLKTFGMIGVELSSPAGEPLQLAPGKKATITLPIPAAIQSVAPASIALWHFNETNGYWQEEGSASRQGNKYVGEVSHFSFWNCDVPADYILLNGCLGDATGQPLANVRITLISAQYGSGYGYTDAQGMFGGMVPANEALALQVLDNCYNIVDVITIGPFSTNTTLNKINVSLGSQTPVTVSGDLVDCNNLPLVTGLAYVYDHDTLLAMWPTDVNGHFQGTFYTCYPLTTFSLTAYDAVNPLQSTPVAINVINGVANAGTIPVCSSLDEYVILQLGNSNYTYTFPSFFSSADQGNMYAYGAIDSSQVQLSFTGYSAASGQATITFLSGAYDDAAGLHYYGCEYCAGSGCNCQTTDTGPVVFTAYPLAIGDYATGSASGTVWDNDVAALVPYSLTFRIKKVQ